MKLSTLFYVAILGSFTLTGCSSHPLLDTETQNIKNFTLKQDIKIAPNSARAYFQGGQYLGSAGFNQFSQHCRLEIKTLKEAPQTIKADQFIVTSINTGEEMIAQNTQPIQLAMNNVQTLSGLNLSFGEHNRVETMDLIHLYLKSKYQPDVMRLTCAGSLSDGSIMDAPYSHRPDKKIINNILGIYGKVE